MNIEEKIELPLLVVRNVVIFPYMVIPLNVGREFSVRAVEESLKRNSEIAIFTQKKIEKDEMKKDDIYEFGVLTNILKMVRFPDGTLRILVEAIKRIELKDFKIDEKTKMSKGEVVVLNEIGNQKDKDKEEEALYKIVKNKFETCLSRGLTVTPEIISPTIDVELPGRLSDIITAQLDINLEEKYNALKELDVKKRLELTIENLNKELDVLEIKNKIQDKIKKGMDETQKEFFLREQLKAIEEELGIQVENDEEVERYKNEFNKRKFPNNVKKLAEKEIDRLSRLPLDSSEAGVIRSYLDFIIELPWKDVSKGKLDVKKAKEILDETHYGLKDVKERILEYLSVKKISKELKTPILCLVGPPGVGKTSIGKAIAEAMSRKFIRISLGGVRDEAEIRGHRRTYVGALPGRILTGIKQSGKSNPVFMLDEIDKLGYDFRGDPSSAMLEVLDPEQNIDFVDHYLEMGYDLSKVFFITTANRLDTIPAPLRDRMEIIRIPGYSLNEKAIIAEKYLIPRQKKQNGIEKYEIVIEKMALEKLILNYTREAGVRNLEREIGKVFRKIVKKIVMGEEYPEVVNENEIEKLLGIPKYEMSDTEDIHDIGVVTGLAWTEFGGDVLNIEVNLVPGHGELILTGKLGDVMKESARIALTYIRSKIDNYNGDKEYYKNYDLHIHVPEGAVPKDGPSAGITLTTAIASKLLNKPISNKIAMTGEITLTGRILPIGGLKEKLLAAKLRGIKKVFVPKKNEKDLIEIDEEIKSGIEIKFVNYAEEVFEELQLQQG
ncbi:endopeptidase La [Haliovirga abyssi]|uniref:Lon protease n=1 Tax=Haliovirga abyssi TaxID=2996794 RepID=A0AAU9E0A6_9FUSO|nr:endopeptidase La [Haliovirga abyssi]BDU49740.1 Lon protease [Haliovirga abyssi]